MKNPLTKYTDDQLYAELKRRKANQAMLGIKHLNINGITVKDFIVEYADWDCRPGDKEFRPYFAFFIKHGKKNHCIYYDYSVKKKWWPTEWEAGYGGQVIANAAFRFIPKGFAEAMENAYDYQGTTEEGIECLKKHGFKTIINVQEKTGLYEPKPGLA
jgi:hypothetical protein